MTRAFVLDPTTKAIIGLVDQSWDKLRYTRRYQGMDTFTLSIYRSRLWASELQKGRLLYLPDEGDRVFLIEQIQSVAEGSARNDLMTVSGRSIEGIGMAERLVIPAAGQAYDRQTAVVAETAIKHYVTDHASVSALVVARRIPTLTVVATGGTGAAVTVAGRYQTVFDLVRQIGLLAGMGWEILLNPTSGNYEFDTILGVDRSTSVFFDFAFETLERWEELESVIESKTVALVAGQGEGAAREIVTRWDGTEPTGFARREAFIDARDIEPGQTAELNARGDAFLDAASGERALEAGIHQYGAFRYLEHWDLGDLVLVRNEERGLSYSARVAEVEVAFSESAAAPVVTAVLSRPFPTLKEQQNGAGPSGGAVDYPSVSPTPVVNVFTGNGTWNKPAGISYIVVEVVGGGGAGGSADASTAGNSSLGSGGGGGGFARKVFTAAQLASDSTYDVVVGAGGTAVAGGNGNTGGTSSVAGTGITTVQATGGGGGINAPNGATAIRRTGGLGGLGSGGDQNVRGGPGGEGIRSSAGTLSNGGHGGDTHYGGGAPGTTNASGGTSTPGTAGGAYGGGGGGGLSQSGGGAALAGAGAAGVVIVTEYY